MAAPNIAALPAAAKRHHDVVIVGAGVAGAILAKELATAGKKVLLIEAGRATSIRPEGYASYVETFYKALAKTPNSPYPQNAAAPSPSVLFQGGGGKHLPYAAGYHVYKTPLPFLSTYTKTLGGTTLHFLGTCMRMLPEDFELKKRFKQGVNWPIKYRELIPFYEQAELEMGVSADPEMQKREGAKFSRGYEFPMLQIPPTFLDRWLEYQLGRRKKGYPQGLTFPMGHETKRKVEVVGTPAGRNGMPNPKFKDPRTGEPFKPIGAPYDTRLGQRCEGNTNCVPICPVMAKYNALRTLYTLDPDKSRNLEIITQAVAYDIEIGRDNQVTGIKCKLYDDETSHQYEDFTARGKVYVIAAHAIESAKLLLASRDAKGVANSSGTVGQHLMDHPYLLTWGLAPRGTRLGVHRGPQITSEIPMRHGEFRHDFAAFRGDIRNGGWDFATGSPYSDLLALVKPQGSTKKKGLYGKRLRQRLHDEVQRHISFGFEIEQLPEACNKVEIDPDYKDALGNFRPVLSYSVSDYTKRAMKVALDLHRKVLAYVGGEDKTDYSQAANVEVDGEPFWLNGSGHVMGTHRMGKDPKTSVVDGDQRTHDHDNLFLVGCGNMPTVGTSNPTLTLAALAFKAAAKIKQELRS